MKNSQSKLRPPCPWVPQLLTELCLNLLISSVDKAEIDDLAASCASPGLEESSSLRTSSSSAPEPKQREWSSKVHFPVIVQVGWGSSANLVCRSHHPKHSPWFCLLGNCRWEKEAAALISQGFAVKEESKARAPWAITQQRQNALYCLVPSPWSNTLGWLLEGRNRLGKVPLNSTIAAEIVPSYSSKPQQGEEGDGDSSRTWWETRVVLKDSTKNGIRESSLALLLPLLLQELRAIWVISF